jgi:hypothetical protein
MPGRVQVVALQKMDAMSTEFTLRDQRNVWLSKEKYKVIEGSQLCLRTKQPQLHSSQRTSPPCDGGHRF